MVDASSEISVGPSSYFDFLAEVGYAPEQIHRLNWRHAHIIRPVETEIANARILDLGSHDGRWPIAYADAGAREVVGIEGRASLVEKFHSYPGDHKGRINVGDFVEDMDKLIAAGDTFDIVSCLGVYYHTFVEDFS